MSFLPYKIISTISEDSQTMTYLSQNELLGQKVVLKCLKDDFLKDKAVCDSFRAQAQTQARHTHANLPVLYDLIEKNEALFTVSEYIQGENLQQYIAKNGAMTDIKILEKTNATIDNEAIRVLKSLRSKWTPGIKNGEAVRTLFTLPITVVL